MTLNRLIVTGQNLTALVDNIRFELSRLQQTELTDIVQKGNRVMATRTTSTVYENHGSGPMWVGISLALSAPGALGAQLQIGGVTVARGDNVANKYFYLMGIVQPTERYLLTATGGVNVGQWVEFGF